MDDSILNSVKKKVNLTPDNDEFDDELIDYINSAFGTLHQLGIGPIAGFMIEDATATWTSFLGGDIRFNPVKLYVAQKVRRVFDPPSSPAAIEAMKETISELEFRLSVLRENSVYGIDKYSPNPGGSTGGNTGTNPPPGDSVFDGGGPADEGQTGAPIDGGDPSSVNYSDTPTTTAPAPSTTVDGGSPSSTPASDQIFDGGAP